MIRAHIAASTLLLQPRHWHAAMRRHAQLGAVDASLFRRHRDGALTGVMLLLLPFSCLIIEISLIY